jgi:hypothetical protein
MLMTMISELPRVLPGEFVPGLPFEVVGDDEDVDDDYS